VVCDLALCLSCCRPAGPGPSTDVFAVSSGLPHRHALSFPYPHAHHRRHLTPLPFLHQSKLTPFPSHLQSTSTQQSSLSSGQSSPSTSSRQRSTPSSLRFLTSRSSTCSSAPRSSLSNIPHHSSSGVAAISMLERAVAAVMDHEAGKTRPRQRPH